MKTLYEHDKNLAIENIQYVSKTIINRLYTTFDSIEGESKAVEAEALEKSSRSFNPDTMDETHGLEEAYHEGVHHFLIHSQMKQEFINSAFTWIFHLFEKECNRVFDNSNGDDKKKILQDNGIDTSAGSLWEKCNSQLRLISNTIKHGEGKSSRKLFKLRPDLFKENMSEISKSEIEPTIEELELFLDYMCEFWEEFFSAVLTKL